nr:hypothetical protein [uncultured Sphaerochaeta sp.]
MRKRVALKLVHNGFRCRKDIEMKAKAKWVKLIVKALKKFCKTSIPASIPIFGNYQGNYEKSMENINGK